MYRFEVYQGKWTVPGKPLPSSHLLVSTGGTRCDSKAAGNAAGLRGVDWRQDGFRPTDEPPATGKTCESCLRLSRRDG